MNMVVLIPSLGAMESVSKCLSHPESLAMRHAKHASAIGAKINIPLAENAADFLTIHFFDFGFAMRTNRQQVISFFRLNHNLFSQKGVEKIHEFSLHFNNTWH
jgi:hypothetical protein